MQLSRSLHKVSTDLQNPENSGNLKQSSESQGNLLRELIFSQSEGPNLEEHASRSDLH